VKLVNYRKSLDLNERASARTLLPLVAIGGSLAVVPASALELGELTVQSNLGQPLRASIAYALAPSEMLSDSCVAVSAGRSTGGLPGIGSSTVTITERAILITGNSAIREPLLGTRVTISCPYTPNLSREYMLLVDPAPVAATASPLPGIASAPVAPSAMPDTPAPSRPATSQPAPRAALPVGESARYQVRPGDSLSGIVSRIENRSLPLWPAVDAVFAANPDAFIDNDPNRLKAGSWLTIPSLDGSAPVVAAPLAEPAPGAAGTAAENAAASATDSPTLDSAALAPSPGQADANDPAVSDAMPSEEAVTIGDATADLKPGDVVIPTDVVPETEATVAIPDTELEGPQTTSSSPNVPTAIVSTGSRSESTSLLMWLLGGGLAIAAALLLFGRRARDRFRSTPAGAVAAGSIAAPQGAEADDYDIDDDSPTEENLVLDADLEIGTGLDQGVEVDTAQDFGFAATSDLDIELPFEPEAPAQDSDTDIIVPVTSTMETILDSEVLPDDEDYDMSVIMDATKMPQPDEVTERDLQAVALDNDEADGGFTINEEVAFDILEQDYEDELTATQALNQEIERAAAELATDLDETVDEEETSALPHAPVGEPDATAELPTRASEETVEFEASYDPNDTNAVTVNMSSEEKTAEMPVANDDETVEMDVEGGKVDTRKG
jgi:hypothetical protein